MALCQIRVSASVTVVFQDSQPTKGKHAFKSKFRVSVPATQPRIFFRAPGAARGATATLGEVWALYAQPDAWGTGAGTALLRAALGDLAAAGHDACALWVLADNARAVAFYRRAGFTEVPGSRQAFEIGGRMLDEVQMRLVGAAFAAAAGLAGVAASGAADAAGGAG